MPGPEQLIRGAITLPFAIARRVVGIAAGLLPGDGDQAEPEPEPTDVDIAIAADDAMTRERDPVEEAPLLPDDDLGGHIEPEVEVVAESADPEATDPPGPDVHVDDALKR
jgi:hypothetical protein